MGVANFKKILYNISQCFHKQCEGSKMVTLRDVALRAQVSVSTVSRYLNGRARFSAETVERIERAMEELHFVRKSLPVRVTQKPLCCIGVVVPDVNPFFSKAIKYLELVISRYNHFMILCNADNSLELENNYLCQLESCVKGFILSTSSAMSRRLPISSNIPFVMLHTVIEELEKSSITCNIARGSRIATSYLIKKHRRRIAFIKGRMDFNTSRERLKGFLEAMRDSGLDIKEELLLEGDLTYYGGYRAVDALLKKNVSFDALIAGNDTAALGSIQRLREAGIKVPEEVAVVGFDDISEAKVSYPKLTTVHIPLYEMCKAAVDVLFETMKKPDLLIHRVFEPELVIRQSA